VYSEGVLTEPLFESSALVTIDVQRDTLDGAPFEIPGTTAVLPQLRRLAEAYRRAQRPILHVVRVYLGDGSMVDLCRRELLQSGRSLLLADSEGVQLATELLPDPAVHLDCSKLLAGELQSLGPTESILYKPRWGAFFATRLEEVLRSQGVTTVVFAGCNFPNCPRTSIYQASERDFRVVLVEDAISGLYDRGRDELRNIGVHLLDTDAACRAL
jgi:nicotinamidase-related amidase